MPSTVLIDRRSIHLVAQAAAEVAGATFCGLDCETQDDGRHDGLNQFMNVNEETRKKAGNKKLVFDHRRTVMTGFSVYAEGSDNKYYINLAQADVENRLTFEEVRPILDALSEDANWVAHNAVYEVCMFSACHNYPLPRIICTMILSVTAFGDDNYDIQTFRVTGLLGMEKLVRPLFVAALRGNLPSVEDDDEEDDGSNRRFSREVDELIGKISSKASDAEHSYNGYIDEMAYGHGLKQLISRFFGSDMITFDEVMNGNAHMGQLTGDQVVEYGADDAFWVIPLFRQLMTHVAVNSPNALETFFTQENPMVHVYADLWLGGMRVNLKAIERQRDTERSNFAATLRKLRVAMRDLVWPEEPNTELVKRQDWYQKNWGRYRAKIQAWVDMPDEADDLLEACRVSNAVSNAWRTDGGKGDLSITHYMSARTIYYDLLGAKLQFDKGKLVSDGEARGKIMTWLENNSNNPAKVETIQLLGELASIETRMKMYLTPYMMLTDPETGRLYPTVSSLLNTRRLAASIPNVMALAKRGESTYVRGFFEGDS